MSRTIEVEEDSREEEEVLLEAEDLDTKVNPTKRTVEEIAVRTKGEATIKGEISGAEDHHLEEDLRAEDLSGVTIAIKKAI